MRILVVGGDAQTTRQLEAQGHVAARTRGAEDTFLRASRYDVIVLDSALPTPLALALCRGLRARGVEQAVLLLVGRDEPTARIEGLDAGADDCLSTPFLVDELLARLRALVRRSPGNQARAGTP
jgi:DNA-binding response OmpR family regulator